MLEIGSNAPEFTLRNSEDADVNLYDFLKTNKVVLYFYPKNETPGCIAQACAFRDQYEDFVDAGAVVVGVSQDSPESHAKVTKNRRLPFTLLSDPGLEVAKLYHVTKTWGIIPGRVTYLIDKDGSIKHRFRSQFEARKHIDQTLKALAE